MYTGEKIIAICGEIDCDIMVRKKKETDFDWFIDADLSKYSGKWIAIMNKKVIVSSKKLSKYFFDKVNKAKTKGEQPTIAKIPNKGEIRI